MLKMIGSILAIGALLGLFFNVYNWQEHRYALSIALAQTDKKVDYHIADQQRDALEKRIEILIDRYKNKPIPREAKELLDDLRKRLAEKEKQLKALEKK